MKNQGPSAMSKFFRFETILVFVLLAELAIFAKTGNNFWTADNFFGTLRIAVEVGLLALAMTPVILTGGIDLSVGSLLGLSAIVFGKLWRDANWPLPLAAAATLVLGAAAGFLNASLITRLALPPLIVTLGSFSLFRGLAEAITKGVDNFTGFPDSFTFLGNGYLGGYLPAQVPILIVAAIAFWLLVHRTTFGRTFRAIGFSPQGTEYAGINVKGHITLVYVLSGLSAALAALVYVARLNQAKADAGTGYELLAITAVVLGGTSIFGGVGSIHGTLLGLAILTVLKKGLPLSDQPEELVGILTGALLLVVLASEAIGKLLARHRSQRPARPSP